MGISFHNTYRNARRLVKTGKRAIMVLQCLPLDKLEYVNGGFPYLLKSKKTPTCVGIFLLAFITLLPSTLNLPAYAGVDINFINEILIRFSKKSRNLFYN
jgi:hypothetical protein